MDQRGRSSASTAFGFFRLSFRPDFPPALFNAYQKNLPAERFLRGPIAGWEYHKGKWTGGYESIVNAERDWPAFALYRVPSRDVSVSGRFLLDGITEQSAVLLRANPRGAVFEGYSVLLDKTKGEIAIRRHQGEKTANLSRQAVSGLGKGLDIAITLVGGKIVVRCGSGEKVEVEDPAPIGGRGRVGVSAWGGSVSIDGLTIMADGQTYAVAEIDYGKSRFVAPGQTEIQGAPQGWSAYGGDWSVGGNEISVARESGPKLLWDAVGPLGDGDSLKAEVRIVDGIAVEDSRMLLVLDADRVEPRRTETLCHVYEGSIKLLLDLDVGVAEALPGQRNV